MHPRPSWLHTQPKCGYPRPITGSRTFLGETPDERRARRRDVLLDATLTIAHEKGLGGVGVRSLRAVTGLNQRYFYENFNDVDDALIAVLDRITGELLVAGMAALHASPLETPLDRARHGLSVALGVILDDPRKATLLGGVGAGSSALQDAYRQRIMRVAEAIVADPEAAIQGFDPATALYVAAGSGQLVLAFLSGDLDLDRDELADKLARLAIGATGRLTD